MRTTLNLDDDVAARLEAEAKRAGVSLSRALNDLVRAGLRARSERPRARPFKPRTFRTGRPLLDVTDVSGVLDRLDDA